MMKLFRKFPWIFVMMLQAFLGIGAGLLILSSVKINAVSTHTQIGGLSVDGMSLEEAKAALTNYFDQKIETGILSIEVDKKLYKIAYTDLDVSLDTDKTLESLRASMPKTGLNDLISGQAEGICINPVLNYNSGKLMAQCETIFSVYENEAILERYEVKEGVLRFIPQQPGIKVDYSQLEQALKTKMASLSPEPYTVDTQSATILVKSTMQSPYSETFTTLVSKAQVPLDKAFAQKARESLNTLDGQVIIKGGEINLGKLIDFGTFSTDVEKDLLNRIATALYQSALSIDGVKKVNRRQSQYPVAYSEPGLEAVIEGEGANLVLNNETDRALMLLYEIKENSLTVYIASTGELKSGILFVQKKDEVPPSVITSVNSDLKKGETKVVSEGTPGYTVSVSRVIDDEREELYNDKYQPVSKIVETGEAPLVNSSK